MAEADLGGQETGRLCQVTQILGVWQGAVGGAEKDRGWQRPTGGLGHKGTVVGEASAREQGGGMWN